MLNNPTNNEEDLFVVLHFGVEVYFSIRVVSIEKLPGESTGSISDMRVLDLCKRSASALDINSAWILAKTSGTGVHQILAVEDGNEDHGFSALIDRLDDETAIRGTGVRYELLNTSNNGTFVANECGLGTTELYFDGTFLIGDVVEKELDFFVAINIAFAERFNFSAGESATFV